MHNLQKHIVGTLVQDWTKNPCLAAGLQLEFIRYLVCNHMFLKIKCFHRIWFAFVSPGGSVLPNDVGRV